MNSKVTKAMIMSAGVGSRLEPLTLSVPKPLVPICNRPVMDILFEKLADTGINDVICNTYYFADQIIRRYENNNKGINFNYIKEEKLSGTAGGLKKCQYFFNEGETFVVLSADGLSNVDLKKGIEIHKKSNAVATIGIKQVPVEEVVHFGVVVTDDNGFIKEFQEKPDIDKAKSNFINTGIYIFDYEIFNYIPQNEFYDFAKNVFPKLVCEHKINTFEISRYWSDIGTLEQYKLSVQDTFNGICEFNHSEIIKTSTGAYISNSPVPDDVVFKGNSSIGSNCLLGNNSVIENSILWDNVIVKDNVRIKNSIIASGCIIDFNIENEILPAYTHIKEKMFTA